MTKSRERSLETLAAVTCALSHSARKEDTTAQHCVRVMCVCVCVHTSDEHLILQFSIRTLIRLSTANPLSEVVAFRQAPYGGRDRTSDE
jgi:hypothetical protein